MSKIGQIHCTKWQAPSISEVEGNFSTNTGFVHVYVHLEILGALFKSDQVLASLRLWSFG